MKALKLLLVLTVLAGSIQIGHAQRIVKVYPRHGTVVTKVYRPHIVHHQGVRFHFSNGIWYKPLGSRFVVTAAPVGIKVRFLPRGYRVVRLNGRKYYRYNGVWYRKSGRFFKVVYV